MVQDNSPAKLKKKNKNKKRRPETAVEDLEKQTSSNRDASQGKKIENSESESEDVHEEVKETNKNDAKKKQS